jgi:hypothetical protein
VGVLTGGGPDERGVTAMLTNATLSDELAALAAEAGRLAQAVGAGAELQPRDLAGGLVEAAKLRDKLTKLAGKVNGANGEGRRRKK